jgi:hypothetical protein
MLPRASVVIVALAAAVLAVIGVTERDVLLASLSTLAAVAFGTNLLKQLPKVVRILMLVVQALAIVLMAVALVAVLSIADAGTLGWAEAPWGFWVAVAAAFFFSFTAIAEGYRGYRRT